MRPFRTFDREVKVATVQRLLSGERVTVLARELKVFPRLLYAWRDLFRAGGAEALRTPGRPRKALVFAGAGRPAPRSGTLAAAQRRIVALERTIGQQQMDLDFFRRALRHVEAQRRASDGPGATSSTRSSKR